VLAAMTSRPASLARLDSRGEIRDGYIADLTIFDPKTVNGRATVADPNQFSVGIDAVIVNGELAYRPGEQPSTHGTGQFAKPETVHATAAGEPG
jgi:N-acyl-D-aspartate/D-glutamate deacylase